MSNLPPLLKAALQLRAETDLSRLFLPAMPDPTPLSPLAQAVVDAHYGAPAVSDATGPLLSSAAHWSNSMTDTPNHPPPSPAAQAVLGAYGHEVGGIAAITSYERRGIAAALRAAADQVVPDEGDRWTRDMRGDAWTRWEERKFMRRDLLAIAAELEGSTRDPLEPHDLSHLSEEEFQALAPQGYHGL